MTAPTSFAVTWDYRCPFARNGHEHILDGLAAGADWDVTFVPFFLNQGMGTDGRNTWDDPDHAADLLALAAAVAVRDRFPERFLDVHRTFFAARHAEGADLRDRRVVADLLVRAGVDADAVLAEVDAGWPAEVIRTEHERCVAELEVFGVPTFVVGDDAVFARLMTRPDGDGELAKETIDRVLGLIGDHPELNEFKHTRVRR
jgi:protein-disulfide isomerase-like protein with CxxC motif